MVMGSVRPMADKYEYTQLREQQSEIRLFKLLPGHTTDEISGELLHVSLFSPPQFRAPERCEYDYEALSYAWGDPHDRLDIICFTVSADGAHRDRVAVTRSLYHALAQLRDVERPRLLWIDAICINQADIPERNSQVRHMTNIYSLAKRVIIWLGKYVGPDPFLDMVVWLEELKSTYSSNVFRLPRTAELPLKIFSRSWFRRKWIIQEVVLAKEAVLLCGSFCLPFDTLENFVQSAKSDLFTPGKELFKQEPKLTEALDAYAGLSNLLFIARCRDSRSQLKLGQLLFETRRFECTDPRDFLFSIINLACDVRLDVDATLAPDYDASLEKVLSRTTQWLLDRYGPNVLSQVTGDDWTARMGKGATVDHTWLAAGLLRAVNESRDDLLHSLTTIEHDVTLQRFGKPVDSVEPAFAIDPEGRLHAWAIFTGHISEIVGPTGKLVDESEKPDFSFEKYRLLESDAIAKCLENWWNRLHEYLKTTGQVLDANGMARLTEQYSSLIFCNDIYSYDNINGESQTQMFQEYVEYLRDISEDKGRPFGSLAALRHLDIEKHYDKVVRTITICRAFCWTSDGRIGLVPPTARSQDVICLLFEAQTPYILRPTGTGEYALIGQACVSGLTLSANNDDRTNFQEVIIR